MKKAKLTLTLNKETVANLNSNEMNEVKGGTAKMTPQCHSWPTYCPENCVASGGDWCIYTNNNCGTNGTAC